MNSQTLDEHLRIRINGPDKVTELDSYNIVEEWSKRHRISDKYYILTIFYYSYYVISNF